MTGLTRIVELGQRIEHRRRTHTARLSELSEVSDFEPPCDVYCTGEIHYDHGDEHLYGRCPLYLTEPPCVIPRVQYDDVTSAMSENQWPKKYSTAVPDRCPVSQQVTEWVAERLDPGIMFHGPVGTGKSSAMGLTARLLWPETDTFFAHWADMPQFLGFDRPEIQRRLRYTRMLAIDDFGTIDHPSWVMARFDGLVEHRYSQGKPFMVTSNLSPETMRKERDWQRFIDRWGETMLVVSMPGASMRAHE